MRPGPIAPAFLFEEGNLKFNRILVALSLVALLIAPMPSHSQTVPPGVVEAAPVLNVPGISAIGSPTFVTPPAKQGGIINIGQAFNEAAAPYIDAAVNALILGLIGLAAAWFKKKTGHDIDANLRDGFTRGLQNQAGSLLADGKVWMADKTLKVNSLALGDAANNLLKSLPDAEKRFGLTPQFVEERIVDMLPQIAAGAAMVAQAHTDSPSTTEKPQPPAAPTGSDTATAKMG